MISRFLSFSLAAAATAHANHIDFISDGGFSLNANVNTVTSTQVGNPGNILGTERDVTLTADLGSITASINAPAGPGTIGANGAVILAFNSNTTDAFGTVNLGYDGVGSAGLGNLDFETNWDFFQIDFGSIVGGGLDLRLNIIDADGSFAQAALGDLTTAGLYSFSFDDVVFTNADIDFGSIDSVIFDFETIDPGVSFTVNSITREAIPEPSSVLLSSLALFALTVRRRCA